MRPLSIGIVLALALAGALFFALRGRRVERRPSRAPAPTERAESSTELDSAAPVGETAPVETEPAPAEGRTTVEPPAREEGEERIVFEMRVRVSDAADGKPVEGAAVTLHDRASPSARRADADGVCWLTLLRPGERARLRVEAPGYFDWSQEVVEDAVTFVELSRAVRVTGKVLAADDDTPVRDARLELSLEGCGGCEPVRARSGEDGAFELAPVPLRTSATLEVRAPGFARARRVFELRGAGGETSQDIHLVRGVELAGRVEDWTSGQGLAGASVEGLTTREDGSFEGSVPAHPVTQRATFDVAARGYATLRVTLDPAERREPLVFRLPRLATLEGQVLDGSGEPLQGATVRVLSGGPARAPDGTLLETSPLYELPEGWTYEEVGRRSRQPLFTLADPASGVAHSDAGGLYRLSILPWALGSKALAGGAGVDPPYERPLPQLEPGSVRRLDWQLFPDRAPCRVQGFVSLNGQLSDYLTGTVSWRGPTLSGSMRLEPLEKMGFHYRFDVEPGDLRFTAVFDVLPELPSREVAVRVREHEERLLSIDLAAPTPPEDAIRGSVRFADDTPVAGAVVTALCTLPNAPEPSLSFRALSDERGEYELRVVDLGLPFTVLAGLPEPLAGREPVLAGAREVHIVLPTHHGLLVRAIEKRTGAALELEQEVQLLGRPAGSTRFWPLEPTSALPDADGWYEFWIPLKENDLLAVPLTDALPGYGTALLKDVRLRREPVRVELELAPGIELDLRLGEGEEAWPADRWLYLLQEELWDEGNAWQYLRPMKELAERSLVVFDADGRATLRGLAPGRYRFKVHPDDVRVEPDMIQVKPGASASLSWAWGQ